MKELDIGRNNAIGLFLQNHRHRKENQVSEWWCENTSDLQRLYWNAQMQHSEKHVYHEV